MTGLSASLRSGCDKPIILTMLGAFWPGNEASGPNQSFKALATALGDQFDFRLLARDRPFGSSEIPATNNSWLDLGYAQVRYCRIGAIGAIGLQRILRETPHDLLWMNGFFDREFTLPALLRRWLRQSPSRPALLSPRGEFGTGALGLKSTRKQAFLKLAKASGALRGMTLHATSAKEAAEIAAGIGTANDIIIAPNIRGLVSAPPFVPPPTPVLRIAFVGRISPVKQLDYALDVLGQVRAAVNLRIFGPVQDAAYWQLCQQKIAALPANISATWQGATSNDAIIAALAETDLFFLPTAGENFGHAIFEALSSGVPVLISDQTPWQGLAAAKAGWDLPLPSQDIFVAAIEDLARQSLTARAVLRRGARARAEKSVLDSRAIEANRVMLQNLSHNARQGK